MKLLYSYLRNIAARSALALGLATINQVFSLLDPLIFRHVIDDYATRFSEYTTAQFFRGVSLLLAAAVGVAFVSRVAKNFQDYYINLITQRLGAQLYSDGIRHSLELPYSVFEDQRSGETLGKLQKVRTDVEKLISASINMLFTSLVGIIFVMVYAFTVHWIIAPVFFLTVPVLGIISSVLSRAHQDHPEGHRGETTALAGSTTESLRNIELVKSLGLGQQEIARLNNTTGKILKLELKKVRYLRSLSFIQGTCGQLPAHEHPLPDALSDLHARHHGRPVLLVVDLLVLHLRPAAGVGQRHQHLPRDRSFAEHLRGHSADPERTEACQPVPLDDLRSSSSSEVTFQHQSAIVARASATSRSASSAARRSRSSGRRAPARRRS